MTRCCATCAWYEDYQGVCFNGILRTVRIFADADQCCEGWEERKMSKVTFTITATVNQRWVDDFCSMLKWMEHLVPLDTHRLSGFMRTETGDFRPLNFK